MYASDLAVIFLLITLVFTVFFPYFVKVPKKDLRLLCIPSVALLVVTMISLFLNITKNLQVADLKMVLYPITFFSSILIGYVVARDRSKFKKTFWMVYLLSIVSGILALLVGESYFLCTARRAMFGLPLDSVCGIVNNPNYFAISILLAASLYLWSGGRRLNIKGIMLIFGHLLGASRAAMLITVLSIYISLLVRNVRIFLFISFGIAFSLLSIIDFFENVLRFGVGIAKRSDVWTYLYEQIQTFGFFGTFSFFNFRAEMNTALGLDVGLQNGYLTTMVIYGYVGVGLYIFYLLYLFYGTLKISKNNVWLVFISVCFLINCIFRTHLLGGIGFISLFLGALYGVIVFEKNSWSKEKM